MKTLSLLLSATSVLLATAMPASAATLLYSYTSNSGNQRFSFNVDSNPTPTFADPTGAQFTVTVQNFSVNGTTQAGVNSFNFYSASQSDGAFGNNRVGDFGGLQLYSGSAGAPTLLTGTFFLNRPPSDAQVGTLTVSTVAAIPEPATWAMMAVGFGLAASAMRRRKVTTRVSYTSSRS